MPTTDDPFPHSCAEVVDSVLYVSRACFEGAALAQTDAIRRAAAARNASMGVSSTLLYQSGCFVHWLEGPDRAISQVLTRIARDARHRQMRLLYSGRSPRLMPMPWSSAVMESPETPQAFVRRVELLRLARRERLQLDPPSLLRQLSTPLSLLHPGDAQRPPPTQRLMVCARVDALATGLVHWLARQHRRKIGHGRFTGQEPPHLSIRYLDFSSRDLPRRLVALPRLGLRLGIVQALLPDYSHLLLLFEGDEAEDLALMQELLSCYQPLRRRPELIGLGVKPALLQPLQHLAAQAGLGFTGLPLQLPGVGEGGWAGVWRQLGPLLETPQALPPLSPATAASAARHQ